MRSIQYTRDKIIVLKLRDKKEEISFLRVRCMNTVPRTTRLYEVELQSIRLTIHRGMGYWFEDKRDKLRV